MTSEYPHETSSLRSSQETRQKDMVGEWRSQSPRNSNSLDSLLSPFPWKLKILLSLHLLPLRLFPQPVQALFMRPKSQTSSGKKLQLGANRKSGRTIICHTGCIIIDIQLCKTNTHYWRKKKLQKMSVPPVGPQPSKKALEKQCKAAENTQQKAETKERSEGLAIELWEKQQRRKSLSRATTPLYSLE